MNKFITAIIIFLFVTGCGQEPDIAQTPKEKQTNASSSKSVTSTKKSSKKKHSKTQKHKKQSKKSSKKSQATSKKHVAKTQTVHTVIKKKPTESTESSKEKSLSDVEVTDISINKLQPDPNRHLFIIGNRLKPLLKPFSKAFKIMQGQQHHLSSINELWQRDNIARQSGFITLVTLGEFLEPKPLVQTLRNIENMPTKKSFFIIFYNYEKNLKPLLENKVLNGLKNILLYMPMERMGTIQNEPSVKSLLKALAEDHITFKQLQERMCPGNQNECGIFVRGNSYLLY